MFWQVEKIRREEGEEGGEATETPAGEGEKAERDQDQEADATGRVRDVVRERSRQKQARSHGAQRAVVGLCRDSIRDREQFQR